MKILNPEGIGVLYVRYSSGRGWLVTHVGNIRHRSTGIPWPEDDGSKKNRHGLTTAQQAAINKALPILKQRALEHHYPQLRSVSTPEPHHTGILLSQAIAEFNAAKQIEKKGKTTVSRYRIVAEKLFIGDIGDMPLDATALRKRIITLKGKLDVAGSYMQKLLYKAREYCEYWVHCGYISSNPIDAIGIPPLLTEEDILPMPPEIFKKFYDRLIKKDEHVLADYIQMVYAMGMRPSEALSITWEDVTDSTIKIKGKRVRGNRSGIRYYAYKDAEGKETTPGIPEKLHPLVKTLERIKKRTGGKGFLFPWRTLSKIQGKIRDVRKELDVDPNYTLKSLRSGAVLIFRDVYKWGVEFRCLQLGHNVAVHIKHYEKKRTKPGEIVEAATTPHI